MSIRLNRGGVRIVCRGAGVVVVGVGGVSALPRRAERNVTSLGCLRPSEEGLLTSLAGVCRRSGSKQRRGATIISYLGWMMILIVFSCLSTSVLHMHGLAEGRFLS